MTDNLIWTASHHVAPPWTAIFTWTTGVKCYRDSSRKWRHPCSVMELQTRTDHWLFALGPVACGHWISHSNRRGFQSSSLLNKTITWPHYQAPCAPHSASKSSEENILGGSHGRDAIDKQQESNKDLFYPSQRESNSLIYYWLF